MKQLISISISLFFVYISVGSSPAQSKNPSVQYTVSFPQPASHQYHVKLNLSEWNHDTIRFKMPQWMPGYYQIMHYANDIDNLEVRSAQGKTIKAVKINGHTWEIAGIKGIDFTMNYDIVTHRQFVANSYVDNSHAYIIPENSFFYIDGFLNAPVSIKVEPDDHWTKIATGLEPIKENEFSAENFDILYDCSILVGGLEVLPTFEINGIQHRFMGYDIGTFDKVAFIKKLQSIVESAISIIGDIPYNRYTFIAIGPGRGGIEHLNNTTVSFDGDGLDSPEAMNRMMNFLAHEYFHHYNVKRIRPYELGPFDYDKGSRTNLLWVSEGLSVYYEYMVVKRAGLKSDKMLLADFAGNINTFENNPGKVYQSLQQASYNTWADGPFGGQGEEAGKTISYYQKGSIVGLLLDFAIRHATQNDKSLDDVMQLLYWKYYKHEGRGFTDAEFQQACETIAGTSLSGLFEYVYTTKPLDYNKYLSMGGLQLGMKDEKYELLFIDSPNKLQSAIRSSWLENNNQ